MKGDIFMKQNLHIILGPAAFGLTAFLLNGLFPYSAALAIATALWMALWWILRPVSIYVTAFLPIIINSLFNLIPASHVISQYFSEIAVLLLGSDLICLTWTTTGLDKRISVRALCSIGTSMKNQIFVWFFASTFLSIFLPNVVVAAIFCPIAAAMLHFVGEKDISKSRTAIPILLAIGWGSGIGGVGSPIGSSANLVAVSYIEKLTGHEFMYLDWVIRFLPILSIVFILNLAFLFILPSPVKHLPGTKEYFQDMYKKFGPMKKGEKIGLTLFVTATLLAFLRPLFAPLLPAMKPAYIFLLLGMLMFFLKDEHNEPMLTWKYAESHAMWGMIALFASGLALGKLVIETGAIEQLSIYIAAMDVSAGLPLMAISCIFACILSELSSNTASASISIPVVTGIAASLGLNPIPYVLGTIAAANCAYILPVSTRAIPISYGLSASAQIRYGLILSALTVTLITLLITMYMNLFPMFSNL